MSVLLRRAVFALTLLFALPGAALAIQISAMSVQENAGVPAVRPDWPVPNEPNQLFYLQRSVNSNTVVYAARYDAAGNLDRNGPAQVYWRRYNSDGERKALKTFERRLAFGIRARPTGTPGEYVVWAPPLPQVPMLLRQTGPRQSELLVNLGGRQVRAVYIHIHVDESGLLPKVTHFSIHGTDPQSGRGVSQTFRVSGGGFSY
jgi:hypothetical protein